MALTSIHVQYNRYTVTESNTSIKEQKIWTPTRSKQPSSLQPQLTCSRSSPAATAAAHLQPQHMTHVYALKCLLDILILIICARMVWKYMRTKEKDTKRRDFSFRWVFQATLWARRSMQVNSSTSHTSSKVKTNRKGYRVADDEKVPIIIKQNALLVQFLNGRGRM